MLFCCSQASFPDKREGAIVSYLFSQRTPNYRHKFIPWNISPHKMRRITAAPKLLGSFSNNDGDGNQDVKKVIGLLHKTTTSHVHHTFLYISLPSLRDYDVKMPNCKFYEDASKRRRISFSLSQLECGPQEINSREIRLHLPFSANWNKRDKD